MHTRFSGLPGPSLELFHGKGVEVVDLGVLLWEFHYVCTPFLVSSTCLWKTQELLAEWYMCISYSHHDIDRWTTRVGLDTELHLLNNKVMQQCAQEISSMGPTVSNREQGD